MDRGGPYLRAEDRPQYERALDEALRTQEVRAALLTVAAGVNSEQLRTSAMRAADAIAGAAASEYAAYVSLREQANTEAASPGTAGKGVGLLPLLAVLVPFLSGLAAVLFLAVGYVLEAAGDGFAIGRPLIEAGLVAGVVCAAALVIDLGGLLLTARRGSGARGEGSEQAQVVAQARENWRRALLDRGILPYLHGQLAEHVQTSHSPEAPRTGGSPVREQPRFASPDFTSPDHEGPSGGETLTP